MNARERLRRSEILRSPTPQDADGDSEAGSGRDLRATKTNSPEAKQGPRSKPFAQSDAAGSPETSRVFRGESLIHQERALRLPHNRRLSTRAEMPEARGTSRPEIILRPRRRAAFPRGPFETHLPSSAAPLFLPRLGSSPSWRERPASAECRCAERDLVTADRQDRTHESNPRYRRKIPFAPETA